ncbi:MAG: slipin family protein [Halothiobacillaceae bacterium]|nr:slipin family protein [Halothiobacillaceae bacterium]
MLKRFIVKKNERGALMRDGDFERLLDAGRHYFWDPLGRLSLVTWKLDAPMDATDIVEYLRRHAPALAERSFECMILGEDEAGLRFENDILVEILAPGTRRFYWKGLVAHRLERVDLREDCRVAAPTLAHLIQPDLRGRALAGLSGVLLAQVPPHHVGILRIDGKEQGLLEPGMAAFWRFNRDVQLERVDTRLQAMEVSGQEILTRDKVSLRLNLAATWRYADVRVAHARLARPVEYLYRELQFGLRSAVGTRHLDELLENKQIIDGGVIQHVRARLEGFGIEIESLGVKDIILPGEMKTLLAQVVEAEKSAQANVIRRREETAATRSLLNTAKVMEDNPVALRLKELETLERVAERIDRISVFGGLDQVLDGLVSLRPSGA